MAMTRRVGGVYHRWDGVPGVTACGLSVPRRDGLIQVHLYEVTCPRCKDVAEGQS